MAELLYPTKYKAKGPWLIEASQLLALDNSLDSYFARSLAAGAAVGGQAGISENTLQRRITLSLRHDKELQTASFSEALYHPAIMNEVAVAMKYVVTVGRTTATLMMERNTEKNSGSLNNNEVELNIAVEPRGESVSEQILTVMKDWSDDIQAPAWQRWVFGLRSLAQVVFVFWLIVFSVYLFTPSAASYKDYYKQEARKILDQGVNAGNQEKALELLLAIESGSAPLGVRPGRDSKAVVTNAIGLIAVAAFAFFPGFCIGIGKGKRQLGLWKWWVKFAFVTVPSLFVAHYFWPQFFALIDRLGTR